MITKKIKNDTIIKICNESASMKEAAKKLKINYKTLKKYAIILNCWNTNQSGKKIKKNRPYTYTIEEIFNGKNPKYKSYRLKKRLIEEGYKKDICEECGLIKWNNKDITLELHHIDGNPKNNKLENLKILCPNCHTQTKNYRNKKRAH